MELKIKIKTAILIPINETGSFGDGIFKYFKIVDEENDVINNGYDFIVLESGLRIDLIKFNGRFRFRIYPAIEFNAIEYDVYDHTLKGVNE